MKTDYAPGACISFRLPDEPKRRTGTVIENSRGTLLIRPDDVRHTLIEIPIRVTRPATLGEAADAADSWWSAAGQA